METHTVENLQQEVVEVLRDLVRIHNERIQGYEESMMEMRDDAELLAVFTRLVIQSREHKEDILALMRHNGDNMSDDETEPTGRIYRIWMYLKTSMALSSRKKKSVLELCEFSEDALQSAYDKALESNALHDAELQALLLNQKAVLKEAHNTIKRHRDELKISVDS